ncbi:MAG: DUF2157 domain-containing protein [Candidatus Paceibacterota bacterium]
MDRSTLLQELTTALQRGEVTAEEVRSIVTDHREGSTDRNLALIRIFSYIGGAIILLGVIVFVSMNWMSLNAAARVLLTLGTSVGAYTAGVIVQRLSRRTPGYLPQALSLIGILLFPIGLAVLLYETDQRVYTAGAQALIAAATMILAVGSYRFVETVRLYLLAGIASGTWMLVSFVSFITDYGSALPFDAYYLYQWLTIVIGVLYLAGGSWLASRRGEHGVSGLLYTLGSIGILGAALSGGDIWNTVFPLVLAGGFVGSVHLRSNGLLAVSSIALVAYLIKVTAVYFPEAVAVWPIALIALGGVIVGVSYGAYRLHMRMQASTAPDVMPHAQ